MDVGVDGDGGCAEAEVEDAVRGFSADAGQFQELLAVGRDARAVFSDEDAGDGSDAFGFLAVAAGAAEQFFQSGLRCFGEGFGGRVVAEEFGGDLVGHLVAAALRDHGGDEHAEGVAARAPEAVACLEGVERERDFSLRGHLVIVL